MPRINSIQNLTFIPKQQVQAERSMQTNPSVTLKTSLNADTFSHSPSFKARLEYSYIDFNSAKSNTLDKVNAALEKVDNNAVIYVTNEGSSSSGDIIGLESRFFDAKTESSYTFRNYGARDNVRGILKNIEIHHNHVLRDRYKQTASIDDLL